MAWDFSTEPEFEDKLRWMREFVREEIWPIETIGEEITQAQLDAIYAPLRQQVKEQGLWAAHLAPELGPGLRTGQARADARGDRDLAGVRAERVRLPGA